MVIQFHSPIMVVAGIIGDAQGRVLIAKRSARSHQGNKWEFPGGKVVAGETAATALGRELREELGITVVKHLPYQCVSHDYGDRLVSLNFFLVQRYLGDPFGCEGQPLRWVKYRQLQDYSFPTANMAVIKSLLDSWPF